MFIPELTETPSHQYFALVWVSMSADTPCVCPHLVASYRRTVAHQHKRKCESSRVSVGHTWHVFPDKEGRCVAPKEGYHIFFDTLLTELASPDDRSSPMSWVSNTDSQTSMASLKALQGSVSWTLYYFMSRGEDVLSATGHSMQACLVQSHAQWSCSCLDCGQTELEPTTLLSSIRSSEPQRAVRMQVSSGKTLNPELLPMGPGASSWQRPSSGARTCVWMRDFGMRFGHR